MNRIVTSDESVWSSFKVRLQPLLRKFEITRAVFFAILATIWGLAAGLVSLSLVATLFTPELQGYYYTFRSLLALQTFVGLGLGTVIIQFASHEWSKLSLNETGQIVGDRVALSRLASLAGFALKWYVVGSVIVALGLGIGGYIFFSQSPDTGVNWVMPWFVLCLLTGITLCLAPIWSLLEGCNQVSSVYTFRFFQGLCSSLAIWVAILLGANLWVVSIASMAKLIYAVVFLRKRYWSFLMTLLFSFRVKEKMPWHSEIWPMQWRIALGSVGGYFSRYFFTPVLFKYHGAVVAGKMGMTWTLAALLFSFASAWVYPRVPRFGMLIAQRKYKELDELFWRITKVMMILVGLGAASIWSLLYILSMLNHPLAARLLAPLPAGLFLLSQVVLVFSVPMSSYLRAHKKEPLLFLSLAGSLMIGLSNLILGKYFSATGMAVGYLTTNLIVVPLIAWVWYRCRTAWHSDVNE